MRLLDSGTVHAELVLFPEGDARGKLIATVKQVLPLESINVLNIILYILYISCITALHLD